MNSKSIFVPVADLELFTSQAFRSMGLDEQEAQLCTSGLIQSELRCHPGQGQGVRRLVGYRQRILGNHVQVGAEFEIMKESPAVALVDAHNGLGSAVGQKAMKLAIEKAKLSGVGTVIVSNSTHYGSSAVHARLAVDHGCIGIAMTSAGPEMAPWGGKSGVLGTNPWGLAAPTGGHFPIVLDIALTTAGKGMMRWLQREEKKMPVDWALTPDGHETDDPAAALQGALLGIGGYKGSGLAMLTDVLTGVLGNSAFGLSTFGGPERQGVAHTFLAFDIDWFLPLSEFKTRIDALIEQVKSAELRPGFEEILVPGEIEFRREKQAQANGADIDSETTVALVALAGELGLSHPFS